MRMMQHRCSRSRFSSVRLRNRSSMSATSRKICLHDTMPSTARPSQIPPAKVVLSDKQDRQLSRSYGIMQADMRKAVHPMKMERFIGILSNLLQCEKVAAPELAEPSEVSRRTIQRDIESLCRAGMDANAKNQSCELGFQPEPIPPRGLSERCAAVQAGKVENRHPAAHQAGRIRRN